MSKQFPLLSVLDFHFTHKHSAVKPYAKDCLTLLIHHTGDGCRERVAGEASELPARATPHTTGLRNIHVNHYLATEYHIQKKNDAGHYLSTWEWC